MTGRRVAKTHFCRPPAEQDPNHKRVTMRLRPPGQAVRKYHGGLHNTLLPKAAFSLKLKVLWRTFRCLGHVPYPPAHRSSPRTARSKRRRSSSRLNPVQSKTCSTSLNTQKTRTSNPITNSAFDPPLLLVGQLQDLYLQLPDQPLHPRSSAMPLSRPPRRHPRSFRHLIRSTTYRTHAFVDVLLDESSMLTITKLSLTATSGRRTSSSQREQLGQRA